MPPCCRLAQQQEGVYHVTDREEVCRLCPIGTDCAGSDASCIRLQHGETTYGYLSVSVDRALGTDTEEDSLLGEVAGDVAFALHGIERAEAMTQVEADRDRAEHALRQSQKMEAIGRLAGGVAHDFNNILTVITASCSFLEEGLQKSEPLLEDVRTISEAAESAVKLTRQLLAFGRRQVLEPRPLDLNVLVAGSEKMLGRLIGEDVAIRVEPAPALGFALVDPGQIEQVIINLAVNARDAMPDGGTLTIATANVELDEAFVGLHAGSSAGPFVKLAATDTGVGMDAETLVRIFEPFFTTKEVGKGTGLGLSTVYGIVKQSGGFIAVDSAPGRGATFEIYLPRVEPAGQPWLPPTEAHASRGRGETILLVEDNDQLREAATRILTKLGYRVFGAAGIDEARRIAATEGPIHLLLTDVVMPGGSGRDVSLAVAAAHPAAKVLYMSGFTDDVIIQRGVLDPGVAFLLKPFTPDSLGRKVREVLDG
jgi:signal transduction histidine kinase